MNVFVVSLLLSGVSWFGWAKLEPFADANLDRARLSSHWSFVLFALKRATLSPLYDAPSSENVPLTCLIDFKVVETAVLL